MNKHLNSLFLKRYFDRQPEWYDYASSTSGQDDFNARLQRIADDILDQTSEEDLLEAIRQHRHKEMCRIAWRDLSNRASLSQTMRETSLLAETLIDAALSWWTAELEKAHGVPRDADGKRIGFCVLGMGKLGGQELNFSSDIDLIFIYDSDGRSNGNRPLDSKSYFIRLGQRLIAALGKVTEHGIAYRVDLRLRPFGESGALALSSAATEYYYQAHGREWERYALIKANVVAGDKAVGRELLKAVKPFIYRRYIDYGAIEQLRNLKRLIDQEARKRDGENNVKLGSGGIREIEFCAQVFQLIRGGKMPELQSRSLLEILDVLMENELLDEEATMQLRSAYRFLRHTENRIQMWDDQQRHHLPTSEEQRDFIANTMGLESWDAFKQQLDMHRDRVAQHFQAIFQPEQGDEENAEAGNVWQSIVAGESMAHALSELGYQEPESTHAALLDFANSRRYQQLTELARQRLDDFMQQLLQHSSETASPDRVVERALKLVDRVAGRSGYLSMLGSNTAALEQFIKLLHGSGWIAEQLTQKPFLLDELMNPAQLFQPLDKAELDTQLANIIQQIDSTDLEQVMEQLRAFKQAQVLRVAAVDIMNMLPLMQVSDQLSWIAQSILETSYAIARRNLAAAHGDPDAEFCIIGYGKLGGLELSYSSDLDLIFLHNGRSGQMTEGKRPIPVEMFFTRLGQRLVHILSAFTPSGRLYEIDTRLRPNGSSGLLVSSLHAFRQYQQNSAWTWEHQALVRARPLAGEAAICTEFDAVRREILSNSRDADTLKQDIVSMRDKMLASKSSGDKDELSLKHDRGGMIDIEFIVQYLILRHAHTLPEITTFTDNIRLLDSLEATGVINPEQAHTLRDGYKLLRDCHHHKTLEDDSKFRDQSKLMQTTETITAIWNTYLS